MERAFVAAGVLALLGVALFVGPMVLIQPAEATYYVDARTVDAVPEDASPVPLEDVGPTHHDDVRTALAAKNGVPIGHQPPSVPRYVSDDGRVYGLVTSVADPGGGGGVLTLASFGLGLVAFAGSAGAAGLGLWRRYRR